MNRSRLISVCAALVAMAVLSSTVSCVVPRLSGQTLDAARARLTRANCKLGKVRHAYSPRAKKGRIASQRPQPGARLAEQTKVNVVVSRGRRR